MPFVLSDPHVFGLEGLGAFHDIECHGLAFLQALEAFALNCREMYEDVVAVGPAQKPNPFASLNHLTVPCSIELVPSEMMYR